MVRNIYDDDTITDQPQRQIVAEMIREKALRCLEEEIPHGIAVAIDRMRERPDGSMMDIDATIICERDSHKGIIIGKGGAMLRKIGCAGAPGDRKHAGNEGESPALGQGEEGLARQRFYD